MERQDMDLLRDHIKKSRLYGLMLLFLLVSCGKNDAEAQRSPEPDLLEQFDLEELLDEADWTTTEIADGVVWKYNHFSDIFDSRQSINIVEVDLNKDLKVAIRYPDEGFLKTSEAAVTSKALAAFNGSFFRIVAGGSSVFFKYDGDIIQETIDGFDTFRENGAVVLDGAGKPRIAAKPDAGWAAFSEPAALASGPLLIMQGEELTQLPVEFNELRHPRTAVGITADHKMIGIVVDGRSEESEGLSIAELSELMHALGCTQALNLDGGGSSTAWLAGNGVVNIPSDGSEREVFTIFTIEANTD